MLGSNVYSGSQCIDYNRSVTHLVPVELPVPVPYLLEMCFRGTVRASYPRNPPTRIESPMVRNGRGKRTLNALSDGGLRLKTSLWCFNHLVY